MNLIHDNTSDLAMTSHKVSFFNPGANTNQVSNLRLNNPQSSSNTFTITGIDDDAVVGAGSFTVTLTAQESELISAQTLESGALGDGTGKWRLSVSSTLPSYVQSLLYAPDAYLSNLSDQLSIEVDNSEESPDEEELPDADPYY